MIMQIFNEKEFYYPTKKARRNDILQLKESTANELKQFLSNKIPQAKAFTLKKGYLMIRSDLEAAKIEYEVDGRFADWHSLRHTTASLLIESGANSKTVQRIMRHITADLNLSKYTHLYAGQVKDTIKNIPDYNVNMDKVIKTGTDNFIAENQQEYYCPKTAKQSEKSRTMQVIIKQGKTMV